MTPGPQRAAPKSLAAIVAKTKQVREDEARAKLETLLAGIGYPPRSNAMTIDELNTNARLDAIKAEQEKDAKRAAVTMVLVAAAFFAIAGVWKVVSSRFESQAYNRLTGAQTTTWDAMWLDLRVQESPQPTAAP